ncbi:transcription repressor NadR [Saliterribacillus persicus]|uniref:Transcriptional regulator n=1 Tax=Saliterribacillus persicus TaxID=930114 RepID=A0A368XFL3_9BACI|nr:transcription repressor NadR [Saliterribacillus persicus]RCW66419.1 hypothetical protein DFR57_109142 [Saliterribacillus persicus]
MKKLIGDERRTKLINWLKASSQPLTGTELANKANVSRQVIVQDISLLKAKDEPILATSNGYIYLEKTNTNNNFQQVFACNHTREQTKEELYTIVDHGVTVKDVIIEHPIYGDLKAAVMVSSRAEVDQFLNKVKSTNAPYLLELTNGVHLHTVEADTKEKIDAAHNALKELDIIIE